LKLRRNLILLSWPRCRVLVVDRLDRPAVRQRSQRRERQRVLVVLRVLVVQRVPIRGFPGLVRVRPRVAAGRHRERVRSRVRLVRFVLGERAVLGERVGRPDRLVRRGPRVTVRVVRVADLWMGVEF
jgi:hypothetical protein